MNNEINPINQYLTIARDASDAERKFDYEKAFQLYRKARDSFKKIKKNDLSAKCHTAYVVNFIKFYLKDRDIEDFSPDTIDKYIKKVDNIKNDETISLLDRYEILISTYKELEDIFRNHFMIEKENEIYYKRTALNHILYWEKIKQKKIGIKEKSKEFVSCVVSYIIYKFCGYGEKRFKAFLFIFTTILFFSIIYYCCDLIQFSTSTEEITFCHSFYFSAITFTSLGYGDIIPIGFGRILVIWEIILGLLMYGVVIGIVTKKILK